MNWIPVTHVGFHYRTLASKTIVVTRRITSQEWLGGSLWNYWRRCPKFKKFITESGSPYGKSEKKLIPWKSGQQRYSSWGPWLSFQRHSVGRFGERYCYRDKEILRRKLWMKMRPQTQDYIPTNILTSVSRAWNFYTDIRDVSKMIITN